MPPLSNQITPKAEGSDLYSRYLLQCFAISGRRADLGDRASRLDLCGFQDRNLHVLQTASNMPETNSEHDLLSDIMGATEQGEPMNKESP